MTREKKTETPPHELLPRSAKVLVPIGQGVYKMRRIPTDVVWHAPATFLATAFPPPGDFFDPVPGGVALGVPAREAGTYTCLVANQQGTTFAMTAGHVVQKFQGRITGGIQVLQPPTPPPAMPPGADPVFAMTVDGFFGNAPSGSGFLDFALLEINPTRSAVSDPLDGGPLARQVMPLAFVVNNRIPMTKFGAATGRTAAVFSSAVTAIVIQGVTVTKVLEFKGIPGPLLAAGGDSGALAVSAASESLGAIIGILIAATSPSPDAPAGRGYVVPFERLSGIRPL
jgi:hypothetical protein